MACKHQRLTTVHEDLARGPFLCLALLLGLFSQVECRLSALERTFEWYSLNNRLWPNVVVWIFHCRILTMITKFLDGIRIPAPALAAS